MSFKNLYIFFFLIFSYWSLNAQTVPNGGFEDGTSNWTEDKPRSAEFSFTSSDGGRIGEKQAIIVVTDQGTNSGGQSQNIGITSDFIPVNGGSDYNLKIWLRSPNEDKTFVYTVRYYSSNEEGSSSEGAARTDRITSTTRWTEHTQTFSFPELTNDGNRLTHIRVTLGVGLELGEQRIDDFRVEEVNVAAVDEDNDGFDVEVDCDDTNAAINPNAVEVNDNDIDENCDGVLGMTVVEPVDSNGLNFGFEDGMTNWEQFTPRGAEYTFDIATSDSPEGEQHAVLNVTNLGTNTPNQGLAVGIRTGFNVPVTGGTYKLSYRIKSATPDKNFRVRLFINDGGDGAQGTINGEVHIAPAEWTLFEQEIVVPELTDTGNPTMFARVILGVGGTLGDISIDDIQLQIDGSQIDMDGDGFTADVDCDDTNAAINPNAPEVNDNEVDENCDGVLGMTVVDSDGLNLGFEEGMVNWEQATPRGAEYTFDIATSDSPEGGQHAVLNVTNLGTNTPNQGLAAGIRTGFNIPVTGGTYKLSYRLKSATPDKNFRARLFVNDGGDGGQGTINGEVHIAPAEWTLFEQEIVLPELTSTGNPTKFVRILLGVAGTLGDISIDDIQLQIDDSQIDMDGDGFTADVDCDDLNAEVNPAATEIFDNEVDEDCDGFALYSDMDGDGFTVNLECDDNNPDINPNAEEIPNNEIDENCDGIVLIIDEDEDGFHSFEDCNDQDPAINPDAEEIPNNEVDEDCDGIVLIIDEDEDGFHSFEDCDDNNATVFPGAPEVRNNNIDEDCDGVDASVLEDFPWLNTIVDIDNCEGTTVEVYLSRRGVPFVYVKGGFPELALYYNEGDLACIGNPFFDCLSFAGLTPEHLVETWECPTTDDLTDFEPTTAKLNLNTDQPILEPINVYPTLSHGFINVSSIKEANVDIINLSGQIVQTAQHLGGLSKINVEDLTEGYYMVQVKTDNEQQAFKVIITK